MDFYETAQEPRLEARIEPRRETQETTGPLEIPNVTLQKSYLKNYIFGSLEVSKARKFLIVEEDTRTREAMQRLIQEENAQALFAFGETPEEIDAESSIDADVIIANYYESEDEVDYEFWDQIRDRNPHLKVIVLSHLNDRESYEMISQLEQMERIENSEARSSQAFLTPRTLRIKNFFGNIFGGRYGH